MSDPDRGAYAPPTDAPLSFDARQPVRGSKPAPLMLIVSAVVLILLVIAIVLFYRSGVREAGQPPQTVGTPIGDMKTPPPAEAQPVDPAAGLQIYRTEDGRPDAAGPTFIAPPETPKPRPGQAVLQPPPKAAPTPSAPVAALPAAPALKPSIAPPPPAAASKAPTPAPKAAPTPAPASKAAAGVAAVQIGAFSSQALADKGWNDAARVAPGLAAGKGKNIERISKDGSTLFRTTVTGFGSRADAAAFCNELKAAGKSCFVR